MEQQKSKFVKKTFYFFQKSIAVPNEMIFNQELSDAAKLLLMALEALPETWEVYQTQLTSMLGFGRDKMQRAMSELMELGYMRRTQKRCEKNRYSHYEYEFYWKPIFKNDAEILPDEPPKFKEENTDAENEISGNGLSGSGENATTSGNRIDSSYTSSSVLERPPPKPSKPSFIEKNADGGLVGGLSKKNNQIQIYECLKNVDMPENSKEGFSKRFSEEIVSKAVKCVLSPGRVVKKSLEHAIGYYCNNPDKIKESKEDIDQKKRIERDRMEDIIMKRTFLAREVIKEVWEAVRSVGGLIKERANCILCRINNSDDEILFKDGSFRQRIESFLRKLGVKPPELLHQIP